MENLVKMSYFPKTELLKLYLDFFLWRVWKTLWKLWKTLILQGVFFGEKEKDLWKTFEKSLSSLF